MKYIWSGIAVFVVIWLSFFATMVMVLLENKSWKLYFINTGNSLVTLVLMSAAYAMVGIILFLVNVYNALLIPLIMLTRILDTSAIDVSNPQICMDLATDLARMDRMDHLDAPDGCNAYRVTVRPSARTYMPGMYRFVFEIQYGTLRDASLEPKGDPVRWQTETLPWM